MNKVILELKEENQDSFVANLEKEHKVSLVAKKANDTVSGYINTHEENGKTIVEVILYEHDEAPTYREYVYNGMPRFEGRKTNIKKADADVSILKKKDMI